MSNYALQHIFQHYLSSQSREKKLPVHYLKVIDKLVSCRTAALGGHAQYCEKNHLCGVWYNSCKHRFCPQCRGMATEEWLENTKNILLNCPHHHIIFTLPSSLNTLWRYNPATMSNILFRAAQETLIQFSQDKKYLNAKPGIISALHTWGRSLSLHPHIHTLITHGGVNGVGEWVTPKKKQLFPQKPLMMVYRGKLIAMIKEAMTDEQWCQPPDQREAQLTQLLNKLGRQPWVVHCCKRYEHAIGVAKYLSRYVKSGPIKKHQLQYQGSEQMVCFQYQSHQTKRLERMKLSVEIFVRRLIQHAPLKGKPSIRYCGVYHSAARRKLNQARASIGQLPVQARVRLQWQAFLVSKGHEVACKICGSPITRMLDVLPVRP